MESVRKFDLSKFLAQPSWADVFNEGCGFSQDDSTGHSQSVALDKASRSALIRVAGKNPALAAIGRLGSDENGMKTDLFNPRHSRSNPTTKCGNEDVGAGQSF